MLAAGEISLEKKQSLDSSFVEDLDLDVAMLDEDAAKEARQHAIAHVHVDAFRLPRRPSAIPIGGQVGASPTRSGHDFHKHRPDRLAFG
jgi:hypothetical protein